MTKDQYNGPHDLSEVAGDARGKAVGTKFRPTSSQLGSFDIIVDVDRGGCGRDDQPLGAHSLVALATHEGEGTDRERRDEPAEHIDRAAPVGRILGYRVEIDRHRNEHKAGQSCRTTSDHQEEVVPFGRLIDIRRNHGLRRTIGLEALGLWD